MFIDAKTVSKAVFVTGNASVVAEGSANDSMLKQLISDDWKVLCVDNQTSPDVSIGYDHATYWSSAVKESAWFARVEQVKAEAAAAPPAPPHFNRQVVNNMYFWAALLIYATLLQITLNHLFRMLWYWHGHYRYITITAMSNSEPPKR